MQAWARGVLVVGTALLAGVLACTPVKASNPLSDPATAKPDPRLLGNWVGENDGSMFYLHVFPKKGAAMELVLVGGDGEKGASVMTFDAFPSVIGGKTYLNLRSKLFRRELGENPEILPLYLFVHYELGRDGALRMAWMNDDKLVKEAVKTGKLKGSTGAETVLTEDSAKLAALVAGTDPALLFTEMKPMYRVKIEVPKAAALKAGGAGKR